MASVPTADPDTADPPRSSSTFYETWLDYLVVALLTIEGIIGAGLGVIFVDNIDRQLAEDFAAEFLSDPEATDAFPLTEPELADVIYTLLTWVSGAIVAAGVITVLAAILFYRYRGDVRDRLADGRRPPRWHAPLLGGLLATALAFIPPAPQVFGGAVAGYVSDRSATVDGALAGLVFAAPAYLLWIAAIAAVVAAGSPTVAGIAVIAMLFYLVLDVVLSAVGGLVGGLLS